MAQIETFRSGEDISLTFAFNVLDIESAAYTVKDGSGNLLVSGVEIDISSGQMSIPVVVPFEHNLLYDKERDLRYVTVKAVASGLVHEEQKMYVLLKSFELAVPSQSFATISEAQMQAIDMLNGDTLLVDGEGMMRKRLLEATRRIKSLPFSLQRIFRVDSDKERAQLNIFSSNDLPFSGGNSYERDLLDWGRITSEQFESFPDHFKEALKLSVISEACEIASGNEVASARDDGLLSESIGETTNMYRTGKSATAQVSRNTWRLLTEYINNRIVIRRA
ncbi:hypothetical protein U2H75_003023 [Escherichia coli]|nr:hypothetical protein [Escherichia coli]